MLAQYLETLLHNLTRKVGIGRASPAEIAVRFDQLRGSGLIPYGLGQSATKLSLKQIVSAILALSATNPNFAATVSIVTYGLKPVGGTKSAFFNCATFGEAIEHLLTNKDALHKVLDVRMSDSEVYTNSYCLASITYNDDGPKTTHYVSPLAVSLLSEGAEKTYNPRSFISKIIRETVFFLSFFEKIHTEIEIEKAWPSEPKLDERVERIAQDKAERARKLGIVPGSRFLNLAVDHQVAWPKTETVVYFEGYRLILTPGEKETAPSIHIDLHGQKISTQEARTLFSRFLSILTWCDDQYAVLQEGVSGNTLPISIHRRNLATGTYTHWWFNDIAPSSIEAKKLLRYTEKAETLSKIF